MMKRTLKKAKKSILNKPISKTNYTNKIKDLKNLKGKVHLKIDLSILRKRKYKGLHEKK